jgi:alkaline phosphatase
MTTRQLLSICAISFAALNASAQEFNSSAIFSHNDYKNPVPFFAAYDRQVGFIEADIFLTNGKLLVAHEAAEQDTSKTLSSLYLRPLQDKIARNKGYAYADQGKLLTLMIDLKTEGAATLDALVNNLRKYPSLTACPTLRITVSGDMPAPQLWSRYPEFIHFDGRPGVVYTEEQLRRVALVSASFGSYSKWNGKGVIVQLERDQLSAVIKDAHSKGKPMRFWGTPDFVNAWIKFMDLKIDVINTDHAQEVSDFLIRFPKNSFHNAEVHTVYTPQYNVKRWKKTPKNVILIIGDGTGLAQWYSGYTGNHGQLNIFQLTDIGFSVTTSADNYITDSAAGATAMATGTKTNNRFIGVDPKGASLTTLAEKCKRNNFNVAIISDGDITDATPASFYAHQDERSKSEAIAKDFTSSNVDILVGGGEKAFQNRKDNQNLLTALASKNYAVSTSFSSIDTVKSNRFVILEDAAVVSKIKGRKDFVSRSLTKSLAHLSGQRQPFFMMSEGAQIDWGGHDNNMEYVVREVLDLDQAVGEAMKFVDQNNETLLIITADHETGGLSLLDGNISEGSVLGDFSTNDHTGIAVPVFSYGPGAEMFRGVYQNTEISKKIEKLLSLK